MSIWFSVLLSHDIHIDKWQGLFLESIACFKYAKYIYVVIPHFVVIGLAFPMIYMDHTYQVPMLVID